MHKNKCNTLIIKLLIFYNYCTVLDCWWLMSQMSTSKFSPSFCNTISGFSRKQLSLCFDNPEATKLIQKGVKTALNECKIQFAHDKWNCSILSAQESTFKIASAEVAFIYAIISGGASHALAKECSRGTIPDCSCGSHLKKKKIVSALPKFVIKHFSSYEDKLSSTYSTHSVPLKEFTWTGCSDNIKYANSFSRKFIDSTEKQKMDSRALMNLHNNRVGRKTLTSNQKLQCKCHGVSGSCVTKTCWNVVPPFEEFGAILKKKYEKAKQVTVVSGGTNLVLQEKKKTFVLNYHNERDENLIIQNAKLINSYYTTGVPANKGDLVFLDDSPDYCLPDKSKEVQGTINRECFSNQECTKLCCGRGWKAQREFRQEPCHCKFIWCCDVKCDTCIQEIERFFCN